MTKQAIEVKVTCTGVLEIVRKQDVEFRDHDAEGQAGMLRLLRRDPLPGCLFSKPLPEAGFGALLAKTLKQAGPR